ncbi:MAG: T9SS type A sorting domain-containing protein [Bacteroidetes bacterium]|nr:T9SS type A sorting domain-containing protein [Bacteroidota bacterium]
MHASIVEHCTVKTSFKMKKQILTAALACFFNCGAFAQPLIDLGSAPAAGQQHVYLTENFFQLEEQGETMHWDLSGLGVIDSSVTTYENPELTPYGDDFPLSNITQQLNLLDYDYFRYDQTGFYRVGQVLDVTGVPIHVHYTDEERILPYPCTYGTVYGDSFSYSYSYLGTNVLGTGLRTFNANAYGTLQLPYGTISNILMLSGDQAWRETYGMNVDNGINHIAYLLRPGMSSFILSAKKTVWYHNGVQQPTDSALSYLSEGSFVGLNESLVQAIGVEAWPVPARTKLTVNYGLAGGRLATIALRDAVGNVVRNMRVTMRSSGIQQVTMEIEGLAPGLYLLSVTDDKGQRGTCKVVVE